jgi:hypothetical protein
MTYPRFVFFMLLLLPLPLGLWAQTDSVVQARVPKLADSVGRVQNVANSDSLKRVSDSLAVMYIKYPDPNRKNRFIDSLMKLYQVKNLDFIAWAKQFGRPINHDGEGKLRKHGQSWVLVVILCLVLGFAVLRIAYRNDINMLMNAFFDHRFLAQQTSAGGFFTSWPFMLLFVLFGFTIGMYLYLIGSYLQLSYAFSGVEWYVILSLLIMGLLILKVYVLRFLGFVLMVQKAVRVYTSILFLSYFHAALLFLPLIVAFSLSSSAYAVLFIYVGMAIALFITVFQAIRGAIHVLSHYQFSKLYLFIYFCALEICPMLVLIKVLRF